MPIKNKIRMLCSRNQMANSMYQWLSEQKNYVFPIWRAKRKHPKSVFLVMTPEHGNLGDHAIAIAEQKLLREIKVEYIEITMNHLLVLKKLNCLDIFDGSMILVNGGGNLGTLWMNVELLFRNLIIYNPHSTIMCLPNTFYYENSLKGKKALEESIQIYNSHSKLIIYAREKLSYDSMKTLYSDVRLVPDMVLSLNESKEEVNRNGCMLCMRNDIEKTRSKEDEKYIISQARQLFGINVWHTDMCLNHGVSIADRNKELQMKFDEFRRSELVITDRLHGMIFSVITGTPCIVINSKSPKLKGCYQWVKDLEYIQFVDDVRQIVHIYKKMPHKKNIYNNVYLKKYYKDLQQDILCEADRSYDKL